MVLAFPKTIVVGSGLPMDCFIKVLLYIDAASWLLPALDGSCMFRIAVAA